MSGSNEFFTPVGLQTLSGFESGGISTAQNPSSTASGLYGFLNSTWQEFAPQVGVDTALYPTAASAPGDVQTQVAAITPASNWLCPGCDAGITQAVSADPSLLTTIPGTGIDVTSLNQDFSGGPEGETYNAYPASELAPGQTAATPSTATAAANPGFFGQLVGDVENLASRAGIVLIGIVLLAGAAFALSHEH